MHWPQAVRGVLRRARFPLPILLAPALVAVLAPAPASAAAATLPKQGVYESCNPTRSADACANRLRVIAHGGFRVVLNAEILKSGDTGTIVRYAEAARSVDLEVMWPLNQHGMAVSPPGGTDLLASLPQLALDCRCVDNRGLVAYIIGVTRARPNTWGYYLADEPRAEHADELSSFTALVRTLDPARPSLILTCGICVGDPADHARPFAGIPAMLGTDSYPVTFGAPDAPETYEFVARTMRSVQAVADAAGRQTMITLQAWRWGDSEVDAQKTGLNRYPTRFPTRAEIEMQRNAALEHGRPKLILWFMLPQVIGWEPGQRLTGWSEPADKSTRWANLIGGAFAPLPNVAPKAAIVVRPRRPRAGGRLRLSARGSGDPDGRIAKYRWYMSGRSRPICRRAACRVRVGRRAGRRRIRLVVTDDRGTSARAVKRVRILKAKRRVTRR